jgi:calcium permeable stress-gated cation channel
MDAYFFVRFLRMMVKIFLPIWFISWAVLLPVNSVNSHVPGVTGLDRFTFGNIEKTQQDRYAAHIILVYFFTGAWIFVLHPDFSLLIWTYYASLDIL